MDGSRGEALYVPVYNGDRGASSRRFRQPLSGFVSLWKCVPQHDLQLRRPR